MLKIEAGFRLTANDIVGTIHTISCSREGDERWRKKVFVPNSELEDFYKKYNSKAVGVFFYQCIGDITSVRKVPPRNKIPNWKE